MKQEEARRKEDTRKQVECVVQHETKQVSESQETIPGPSKIFCKITV